MSHYEESSDYYLIDILTIYETFLNLTFELSTFIFYVFVIPFLTLFYNNNINIICIFIYFYSLLILPNASFIVIVLFVFLCSFYVVLLWDKSRINDFFV